SSASRPALSAAVRALACCCSASSALSRQTSRQPRSPNQSGYWIATRSATRMKVSGRIAAMSAQVVESLAPRVAGHVAEVLLDAQQLVVLRDAVGPAHRAGLDLQGIDRKSTRLNSSHVKISYAVFCL